MRHIHWLTRKRIQELFEAGLGAERHRKLLHELSGCQACLQEYRRYQRIEAALCGSDGPTPFAIERIEKLVLDGIPADSRQNKPSVWAIAAALAAAGITAPVLLSRAWTRGPEQVSLASEPAIDRALLRGGDTKQSDVGIRLFRAAAEDQVEETETLGLDDVITFSYTNMRPEIRYLAVVGIQEEGSQGVAIRWYYPDRDATGSMPIESDKVDEPLGDGFKLGVHHECGWLRVVAFFSEQPIGTDDLRKAVQAGGSGSGIGEASSSTLSTSAVIEHSLLVQIACAR